MNSKLDIVSETEIKQIIKPDDGCELALSADRQWLRLIVSGKQIVSFHVNYVQKILDSSKIQNLAKNAKPPSDREINL